MEPREFAEACADNIIDMLHNDQVLNEDGSVYFEHRGHGGMWNSYDCDKDIGFDFDREGQTTAILSTWIFPCDGEYNCPYLNRYAEGMCNWIMDEDTGEEMEWWDDVATRFFVKVVIDEEECTVTLEIDNQLACRAVTVYKTTFTHHGDYLNHNFIEHITAAAHDAMTRFDGTNPVIINNI